MRVEFEGLLVAGDGVRKAVLDLQQPTTGEGGFG